MTFVRTEKPSAEPSFKIDVRENSPEPDAVQKDTGAAELGGADDSKEDGELSIPVEHTTAAHKLLLWPSIRNLLHPKQYDEDYVMQLEEKRGLIRVFGRGEGDDTAEDHGIPVGSSTEPNTPSLDESNSLRDLGGPSFGKHRDSIAGLDESGMLTTDPETVRRFHRSYIEHIHKLHPFLNQNDLERRIESFIKLYCPRKPVVSGGPLLPNTTISGELPRGAKRKRSGEAMMHDAKPELLPFSCRRIDKSIDNAIVLLVLALGAICEWRVLPIPGPVRNHPPDFRKQRIPGPSTSSTAVSPDVTVRSLSFPIPNNRGPSLPGRSAPPPDVPDHSQPRNLDVIPGLGYYAYASEILGALQGANGLHNVQAALLAGLYAGQLAHPLQSHGWIFQAARACQVLVRPKRYKQMQKGPLKDLHDFAYWTCLQLESDILAELDIPASGISRSESRIDIPTGRFTLSLPNEICAPSTMMMIYYSTQIHLRKVLNRIHTDLYKADKDGQAKWSSNVQEVLSMNLDLWRNHLPDVMQWKDSDPPASDINVARMRGKYYGARYIIHRPLLYHALHLAGSTALEELKSSTDTPTAPTSPAIMGQGAGGGSSSSQPPPGRIAPLLAHGTLWSGPTYRELPGKLRRACKVCIDSAILSTVAFDGVQGRPVVTNIFGTAHA